MAKKMGRLSDGTNVFINFTHVNFPRSDNHKLQLMNTFDLEPCKIIYAYHNNRFFCGKWFENGGHIISDDRKPSVEFFNKYIQKGFNFPRNFFEPVTGIYMNVNDYIL